MIETVRQREKLEPRREPYWYKLGAGRHLGFRRTEDGGTWIARAYDTGSRNRAYQALGEFLDVRGADRFDAAKKAAEAWFEQLGVGGRPDAASVRQACDRYVVHLRRKRGDRAADDAEGRFRRHVYDDPVASIPVAKLARHHLIDWRHRLEGRPAAQVRRGPRCQVRTPQPAARARSASAINRDMTTLRAALNLARRDGYVATDAAWLEPLRAVENADRRRTLYLDRDQRRALIAAASDEIRPFLTALCLLPLRPGAMAALTAGDFEARTSELRIMVDKAGEARTIQVPAETAAVLKTQAKGKLPRAPLFMRRNGTAWDKDAWKGPVRDAVLAAGLPASASAYTLRHSTITDLVGAGLDLFTVAKVAGTSIAMIERHYGHLRSDRATSALAGLAL